jgi:hypothetical protein
MKTIKYIRWYGCYKLYENYVVQTNLRPVQAIETRYILLSVDGLLTIKKGYVWDGPSGPTFNTPSSMRGSLGHDAKYQLIRMLLLNYQLKAIVDHELYNDCIEDKMWKWRAKLWLKSVKTFGYLSLIQGSEPEILTAP